MSTNNVLTCASPSIKSYKKFNEFSIILEDVLTNLPNNPKNFKLKKRVEEAYRELTNALTRHEMLITDSVPPLNRKGPDLPDEFVETWKIYQDYMIEQHGIRMGSRMQAFRLELLIDITNKDFKLATRWLKFYMASGSSNIFIVNELKSEDKHGISAGSKAGFIIPKAEK